MTEAAQIVQRARDEGVSLRARNGKLYLRSASAARDSLRSGLREHEAGVLAMLEAGHRSSPAPLPPDTAVLIDCEAPLGAFWVLGSEPLRHMPAVRESGEPALSRDELAHLLDVPAESRVLVLAALREMGGRLVLPDA